MLDPMNPISALSPGPAQQRHFDGLAPRLASRTAALETVSNCLQSLGQVDGRKDAGPRRSQAPLRRALAALHGSLMDLPDYRAFYEDQNQTHGHCGDSQRVIEQGGVTVGMFRYAGATTVVQDFSCDLGLYYVLSGSASVDRFECVDAGAVHAAVAKLRYMDNHVVGERETAVFTNASSGAIHALSSAGERCLVLQVTLGQRESFARYFPITPRTQGPQGFFARRVSCRA